MSTNKKLPFTLPKLRARDELLKSAPELSKYLQVGTNTATNSPTTKPRPPLSTTTTTTRASDSNKSPTGSPASPTSLSPLQKSSIKPRGNHIDSDDEEAQEKELRAEMARAKKERASLLSSLQKLKQSRGVSGGDLQAADIESIRKDIELRQEKFNELRSSTISLQQQVDALEVECRDCELMCPCDDPLVVQRIATLKEQLVTAEKDTEEQECKIEQYTLLRNRTRRDKDNAELAQRAAKSVLEAVEEDFHSLVGHMHETRAAKEDTERQLGAAVALYDQVKRDWRRKLKDRMKEVQEIEKRKALEAAVRAKEAAKVEELAAQQRAKAEAAKAELERKVSVRVSSVLPQLESLEGSWEKLRAVTGSSTPESVVECWKDLKQKTDTLKSLLEFALAREARAQEDVHALKAQKDQALQAAGHKAPPPSPSSQLGSAAESESTEEKQVLLLDSSNTSTTRGNNIQGGIVTSDEFDSAQARKTAASQKLAKLTTLCSGIEQSLKLMSSRLQATRDIIASTTDPTKPTGTKTSTPTSTTTTGNNNVSRPRGSMLMIGSGPNTSSKTAAPARRISAVVLQQARSNKAATGGSVKTAGHGHTRSLSDLPISYTAEKLLLLPDDAQQQSTFFPELPTLAQHVCQQMEHIQLLSQQLINANNELKAAHAKADTPLQVSGGGKPRKSSISSTSRRSSLKGGTTLATLPVQAASGEKPAAAATKKSPDNDDAASVVSSTSKTDSRRSSIVRFAEIVLAEPPLVAVPEKVPDQTQQPAVFPETSPPPKDTNVLPKAEIMTLINSNDGAHQTNPSTDIKQAATEMTATVNTTTDQVPTDSDATATITTTTNTTSTKPAYEVPLPVVERLVGQVAAPKPRPGDQDPFALSSDDDDVTVMDRAAVKHRAHKITNPKKSRRRAAA